MFGLIRNLFSTPDTTQLSEAINNGSFLVDVRTPAEFSAGSVKGAVNIPLDRIHTQLARFKDKKSIVVFCRSGNRSSQAKHILEQSGFQQVFNGGSLNNVKHLKKE